MYSRNRNRRWRMVISQWLNKWRKSNDVYWEEKIRRLRGAQSRSRRIGKWSIRVEPDSGRSARVITTCVSPPDEVVATVLVGVPGTRGRWGLPAEDMLPEDLIRTIDRLEPRISLARGGTSSILEALTHIADDQGLWLAVDIKPDLPERLEPTRRLFGYFGFTRGSNADRSTMTRKPR